MRNLKKFLALVLAMVMVFSLMLSASAAVKYEDYSDKDSITDEFKEAVQVLTGLGVFTGDENGFRPSAKISRAEAAAVIYRVATGDVNSSQVPLYTDYGTGFKDVNAGDWFAGYVAFCKDAGYIKGTSKTTFSPYLDVTGYELLAMLLRVVGYGKNNEFTGSTWQVSVATMAEQLHMTDKVKEADFNVTLSQPATREVVAALTFTTMTEVPTVTFTSALQYSDRATMLSTGKNPTLGQKIFGLFRDDGVDAIDKWGRPGYLWVSKGIHLQNSSATTIVDGLSYQYSPTTGLPVYGYATTTAQTNARDYTKNTNVVAVVKDEALKVYHNKTIECDIAHDLEWTADKTISSAYIDGVKVPTYSVTIDNTDDPTITATGSGKIQLLDTTNYLGGHGRILEIYDMSLGNRRASTANLEKDIRVVEINTYLGMVEKYTAAGKDKNDHPYGATIDVNVWSGVGDHGPDHSSFTSLDTAEAWAELNWHSTSHGVHPTDDNTTHIATPWDFDGIKVEKEYSAGQYVLVSVCKANQATIDNRTNKASLVEADIRNAEIKTGGFVMNWTDCRGTTPDKTTVGTTTFEDSDKFCLNWRTRNQPYSVAVDEYGYAIGLVNRAQYLVIEKLEWKQSDTIGGGYALMDAWTSANEHLTGVKVSSFNNVAPVNSGDSYGKINDIRGTDVAASVSDYYTNNANFYSHIYSFDVDNDGSYALLHNCDDFDNNDGNGMDVSPAPFGSHLDGTKDNQNGWAHRAGTAPNAADLNSATIARGEATISGIATNNDNTTHVNSYVATDNTVFAVRNTDGYTYTTYVGKNNVPSISNAQLCVVTSNGYAVLVVVRNSNRVVVGSDLMGVYVYDIEPVDGKYIDGTYHYGFDVQVLGGGVVRVYDETRVFTKTGFYNIHVDDNMELVANSTYVNLAGGTDTDGAIAIKGRENSNDFTDDLLADGDDIQQTAPATARKNVNNEVERASMDRVRIDDVVVGGSLQTSEYSALYSNALSTTARFGYLATRSGDGRDYSLTDDTKVYILDMNATQVLPLATSKPNINTSATGRVTVTEGSVSDLSNGKATGTIAYVYYEQKTVRGMEVYQAKDIYVLRLNASAVTARYWIDNLRYVGADDDLYATFNGNTSRPGDLQMFVQYRARGSQDWIALSNTAMTRTSSSGNTAVYKYEDLQTVLGTNQMYEVRVIATSASDISLINYQNTYAESAVVTISTGT